MNFKEFLKYDPITGIITWIKKTSPFSRISIGDIAGWDNGDGYKCIEINGITYKEHRLAWFLYYNKWPENQIDHINGNKSDNRISNLRDVTVSKNNLNRDYHRNISLRPLLNIMYRKNKDFYEVIVKNKYIGGSKDLDKAIYLRDKYLTSLKNNDSLQ
jgi:hypothetical protein